MLKQILFSVAVCCNVCEASFIHKNNISQMSEITNETKNKIILEVAQLVGTHQTQQYDGCVLSYRQKHGFGYYFYNRSGLTNVKASKEYVIERICKNCLGIPSNEEEFAEFAAHVIRCTDDNTIYSVISSYFSSLDVNLVFAYIAGDAQLNSELQNVEVFFSLLHKCNRISKVSKTVIVDKVLSLYDTCVLLPSIIFENALQSEYARIIKLTDKINSIAKQFYTKI